MRLNDDIDTFNGITTKDQYIKIKEKRDKLVG